MSTAQILRGARAALNRAGLTPAPMWLDERSIPAGSALSWWDEGGTYAVDVLRSAVVGEAAALSVLIAHEVRVRMWFRVRPMDLEGSLDAIADAEDAAWFGLMRRASWEGCVSVEKVDVSRSMLSAMEVRQVEMVARVTEHRSLATIAPGV